MYTLYILYMILFRQKKKKKIKINMMFSVYLHNRLWYGMLKVIKQIKNEYLTGPLYLAYNTHGKDKIRTYLQYRRRSVYNQGDTWGIGITAKYRHNTSTRVDGNWRTGGTRREIERDWWTRDWQTASSKKINKRKKRPVWHDSYAMSQREVSIENERVRLITELISSWFFKLIFNVTSPSLIQKVVRSIVEWWDIIHSRGRM